MMAATSTGVGTGAGRAGSSVEPQAAALIISAATDTATSTHRNEKIVLMLLSPSDSHNAFPIMVTHSLMPDSWIRAIEPLILCEVEGSKLPEPPYPYSHILAVSQDTP
jgi:hypothetical protein